MGWGTRYNYLNLNAMEMCLRYVKTLLCPHFEVCEVILDVSVNVLATAVASSGSDLSKCSNVSGTLAPRSDVQDISLFKLVIMESSRLILDTNEKF